MSAPTNNNPSTVEDPGTIGPDSGISDIHYDHENKYWTFKSKDAKSAVTTDYSVVPALNGPDMLVYPDNDETTCPDNDGTTRPDNDGNAVAGSKVKNCPPDLVKRLESKCGVSASHFSKA